MPGGRIRHHDDGEKCMKKEWTEQDLRVFVRSAQAAFEDVTQTEVDEESARSWQDDGLMVDYELRNGQVDCVLRRQIVADGKVWQLQMTAPLAGNDLPEDRMTPRERELCRDDMNHDFLSGVFNRRYFETEFCTRLDEWTDAHRCASLALVALAILLFVLYTSSYFMNSIIAPVGEVSRTARQIAQGDFDVRLDTHNDDEIGQLCASINNMAEELSNAEQVKNDFISSVSHELRTPLTAIRGWGETLLSDDDLDPETRRKGMQVIMGETERLSQMVEELLDFSRIQGGRMVLTRENVDLAAELSDVVLMYTERARRENKTLLYEEPEGVIIVYADRNRLRQVFINILDNAIKYSDGGDTVAVTLTTISGSAVISVADTGIGIAPEELPRVKDRFYKGKSSRRGSGIGLAVADEIINMHGGSLKLTSRKGEGTTVTITLPLARG